MHKTNLEAIVFGLYIAVKLVKNGSNSVQTFGADRIAKVRNYRKHVFCLWKS